MTACQIESSSLRAREQTAECERKTSTEYLSKGSPEPNFHRKTDTIHRETEGPAQGSYQQIEITITDERQQ